MKYLIVHDAAPGQFIHILRRLLREGEHDIVVAGRKGTMQKLPCKQIVYDAPADISSQFVEQAIGLGYDLYCRLTQLRVNGWSPDVILTHASRGASYFLRDLFPDARLVAFFEWFYSAPAVEDEPNVAGLIRKTQTAYITSMPLIRDFEGMDAGYTPTAYQLKQFPKAWQKLIKVISDPVDTDMYSPYSGQVFEYGGVQLSQKDAVITYAARGMEHTRGFVEFMKAAAKAQAMNPDLQVVVAAADRVCYDSDGQKESLKAHVDEHVSYDTERTHFVGLLPEKVFCTLMQVSSLHVYTSKPFVLSWSVLNAMSTGVPVLAADTEPVREVITDGENGFMVDGQDTNAIAYRIGELLSNSGLRQKAGQAARQTIVEKHSMKQTLDRFQDFLNG